MGWDWGAKRPNKSELVQKGLADPVFVNLLRADPAKALNVKTLTPQDKQLVDDALTTILRVKKE